MPRLREFGTSKSPPNLRQMNGSRSAAMSTSRRHPRGTFPSDTSVGVKARAGHASLSAELAHSHVAECLDAEERHHATAQTARSSNRRAALCSAPAGERHRFRLDGVTAARAWPAAVDAPIGAKPASNFDGSAAVQHFCSGQTQPVCYYPAPPCPRRPPSFGRA
jgi:hypothetical protein